MATAVTPVPFDDQVELDPRLRLGSRPHLLAFGAVPNAVLVYDGAISSESSVFSSLTASFSKKNEGRVIYVVGAGPSGGILRGTILNYLSETSVQLSVSASTSVVGAEAGYGTDCSPFLSAAKLASASGGNAMFADGGAYILSETLTLDGNMHWYGPGPHIDNPADVDTSGRYACFICLGNPGVEISPYPGAKLENVHVHCPGTVDAINLWEIENYTFQVGVRLGNIGEPLVTPEDTYAVGGNGGVFLDGVTITGASGWGIYAYKLWGQSSIGRVQIFGCGTVPDGGDPTMHGGIWEASECADLCYDKVHIIGVAAGYAGPKKMGCGVKRGGNGANLDALNRFKIGPTHSKFQKVFIEGKGVYPILEYTAFASTWSQCFFGGAWERIRLGETPTLSWLNHETVFLGCGSFSLPRIDVRSRKTQIIGWMAEGGAPLEVHYNYPGLTATGRNIKLRPEPDDGLQSGYPNRAWESMPIAWTDSAASPYSIVPDFSSDDWQFTMTAPASFKANDNLIRLAQGGLAKIELSGLTPNVVYTCAFRHRVAFDAALDGSTYRVFETGGSDIIALQIGSSDTASAGTVSWVLFQFVAPASGNITFECKNTDFNQTEWTPPFIGFGALTEVYSSGYLIQADIASGTIAGSSVRHTGDQQVWGDIMARRPDTIPVALLGRGPAQKIGIGLNVRHNGTSWTREADGSSNGGALMLASLSDGTIQFIPVESTGTVPATMTDTVAQGAVRLQVKSGGADVLGNPGSESALSIQKVGSVGTGNVAYRISHRPNNQDLVLYAFDGVTFWNVLEAYRSSNQVLINGVDIANLIPPGTPGRFLGTDGGSTRIWRKVDLSNSEGVQFTGGVNASPVKKASSGALFTEPISLADTNQATVPYPENAILAVATGGNQVSYYTIDGLASLLITPLIAAGLRGALAHTHGYLDSQSDGTTGTANGHDHPIGSSEVTKTTGSPNW